MGKRKLRFAVQKNYERKKYFNLKVRVPLECITVLKVSLPLDVYTHAPATNGDILHARLIRHQLPTQWSLVTADTSVALTATDIPSFTLYTVKCIKPPYAAEVTFSLTIQSDLAWKLILGSLPIQISQLKIATPPRLLNVSAVLSLLTTLDSLKLCIGNPEEEYLDVIAKKGPLMDKTGHNTIAFKDTRALPFPTVRHIECSLLLENSTSCNRCTKCVSYRTQLNVLVDRLGKCHDNSNPQSHTNYRYLSDSEKNSRMRELHRNMRVAQRRVAHLQEKLRESTEVEGEEVDESTSADLKQIMEDNDDSILKQYPKESFLYLFWTQQKESLAKNSTKGMRWHPLMIRWCLYLRHHSNKAYEVLREAGLCLPSQRTLRDYTYSTKSAIGFSSSVDQQLLLGSKVLTCKEWEKYMVVLIDEMHIREDLVYDSETGSLIGYTDLGDVNNQLLAFEQSIANGSITHRQPANSMLTFMVKGLFTSFRFPYVHFSCAKLSGDNIFPLFWEVVKRLERIGLKVLAATLDGASNNRKMITLHDSKGTCTHKVPNIYSNDGKRDVFFFSDPPHLIKTARNCLASKCRFLWCNGEELRWEHLLELYKGDTGKASGLALVPKLKYEHVYLTSFSKMRVDLAAQALSESVSKALKLTQGNRANGTARFIEMMDKFFDALNVSNFTEGKHKRKPFQNPYRSDSDFRLTWLEDTFLPYLDKWEESVQKREGFSKDDINRMQLSTQTKLGLRVTALSFVGLVRYLFSLTVVKEKKLVFLSNNLCQDPLEQFFGCQRQRGGTSDNPNAVEFTKNTQALRVVDTFCRGPVKGNCRKRKPNDTQIGKENEAPLAKRRKVKK